ncbi:hypothetical protein [Streptomyces sp. NPDC002490]|uniref:hypothetical protein n=1 Tax=Streptomyces sp. NPDC002490 TaxID=3154416 RepID=UPI00332989A5
MDPYGRVAQRFPLVARPRPACLPLVERVHTLCDLAQTAARRDDPSRASAVYNQSALLASDVGLPTLARDLCRHHADAYLHAGPLPSRSAIRALEPVVNLARLHIRAGRGHTARQHLLTLYEAVGANSHAHIDSVTVPAHLTATAEDRREVRNWLWTVLLADGARALTTQGRWTDALTHVEEHRGVGKRMLDGRQISVLAALTADDPTRAAALLHRTMPGEPWEQVVTACLTALGHRATRQTAHHDEDRLVSMYEALEPGPGTTVFNIRLGLTVLDIIGTDASTARRVTDALYRRTIKQNDGYAALENLQHPGFTALVTVGQRGECREILDTCALGDGKLPSELRAQLTAALHTSDHTIRNSVPTLKVGGLRLQRPSDG